MQRKSGRSRPLAPADDDLLTHMATMDETLGLLSPAEIDAVTRFIEVCELVDEMSAEEAALWRHRIAAWNRYLQIGVDDEPNA